MEPRASDGTAPVPESVAGAPSPRSKRHLWWTLLLLCLGLFWHQLPRWQRLFLRPPADPAFFQLSAREIFALPLATRWDWPMGAENGAMTYNAQKFRLNRHLGDDLNGIGGGDSDLGDPVHAAGFGQVVFANDAGPGWGNMVILAHRIGPPDSRRVIQTVYAHLQDVSVQVGQVLQRGDCLGSVGNAGGRYLAHLHFEVREGPFVQAGVGYADSPLNRLDPQTILRELGPNPPDLLNPAPRAP